MALLCSKIYLPHHNKVCCLSRTRNYCAEGAISSECKWVSAPEVLINRVVKRIWDLVAGPVFWATCGLRDVFEVQNRDPPASGSGPILFDVCRFFWQRSFGAARRSWTVQVRKKSVKKRLLQCISGLNSTSFRTSSQMVQREWHSHGVHWTAATGRTLLSRTSVVSRLCNLTK